MFFVDVLKAEISEPFWKKNPVFGDFFDRALQAAKRTAKSCKTFENDAPRRTATAKYNCMYHCVRRTYRNKKLLVFGALISHSFRYETVPNIFRKVKDFKVQDSFKKFSEIAESGICEGASTRNHE